MTSFMVTFLSKLEACKGNLHRISDPIDLFLSNDPGNTGDVSPQEPALSFLLVSAGDEILLTGLFNSVNLTTLKIHHQEFRHAQTHPIRRRGGIRQKKDPPYRPCNDV
jgi:hypothetical protein